MNYHLNRLLLLSMIVLAQLSFAQVEVDRGKKRDNNFGRFTANTTYFVLPDTYSVQEYQTVLEQAWDITPFQIISFQEYVNGAYPDGVNLAKFGGYTVKHFRREREFKSNPNSAMVNKQKGVGEVFLHFNISLPKKDAKDASERHILAGVWMFPQSYYALSLLALDEPSVIAEKMYTNSAFHNFSPALLKNYLQRVNALIKSKTEIDIKDDIDAPALAKLKTKTLYIPEFSTIYIDPYRGQEKVDKEEAEDALKGYDYDYKFITDNELNQKILNGEDIYYLRYVRFNSTKIMEVVNAASGDVIYKEDYTGLKYNLKKKHYRKLSKAVKKA